MPQTVWFWVDILSVINMSTLEWKRYKYEYIRKKGVLRNFFVFVRFHLIHCCAYSKTKLGPFDSRSLSSSSSIFICCKIHATKMHTLRQELDGYSCEATGAHMEQDNYTSMRNSTSLRSRAVYGHSNRACIVVSILFLQYRHSLLSISFILQSNCLVFFS